VASVGGILCTFNQTVYQDTLLMVPDVVDWGAKNISRVNSLVFIAYRAAALEDFDFFIGEKKVDFSQIAYATGSQGRKDITAQEIFEVIRKRFPDFSSCAYLNGKENADSLKFINAIRLGQDEQVFGCVGPKFSEVVQMAHHLLTGRYVSHPTPSSTRFGKAVLFTGAFDSGVRGALKRYLGSFFTQPLVALKPVYMQSITLVQAIDILPDGRQDICDACPDMTLYDGKLVWCGRVEELRHFGRFVQSVPRASNKKPHH
jgi:hypothetical protein